MRKIINRIVYDTEKAEFIYQWSVSNNISWVRETLYKTKSGHYFSHETGAYKKSTWEKIYPMTLEEARYWGEFHMDTMDYNRIFK